MKMSFEKRPTCSCGEKMKFIEYQGYYDSFWYWDCDKCNLHDEMEKVEPDEVVRGAYT